MMKSRQMPGRSLGTSRKTWKRVEVIFFRLWPLLLLIITATQEPKTGWPVRKLFNELSDRVFLRLQGQSRRHPGQFGNRQREGNLAMNTHFPLLGISMPNLSLARVFHGFQLIEQGLVTDSQDLRCLTAVPTSLGEDSFDRF